MARIGEFGEPAVGCGKAPVRKELNRVLEHFLLAAIKGLRPCIRLPAYRNWFRLAAGGHKGASQTENHVSHVDSEFDERGDGNGLPDTRYHAEAQ